MPPILRPTNDPREGFRFVHLTDIHLQPELKAVEGFVQCLAKVEKLHPKPDFILTGGDLIMDAFDQDVRRAKDLFRIYRETLFDHTDLPVYECLGNHDVFGWSHRNGVSDHDPLYGKRMFLDFFGLPRTYYRFDHRGWRFYVLDDIQPAAGNAYQAYIDEAQLAWFEQELKAKPAEMPAAVVSHIPIVSVTVLEGNCDRTGHHIGLNMMCRDAYALVIAHGAPQRALVLSGHMHQYDRIDFRGITFVCDGAVSGNWWRGKYKGLSEGFGILDVTSIGDVKHSYCDFGWRGAE